MRFAFFALIITVIALPFVAKAYDNAAIEAQAISMASADMMAVIADMDQPVASDATPADVTAMAQALNALNVGSVQ